MEQLNVNQDSPFKYVCDKCHFKCMYKSVWEKHINTDLHKTGVLKRGRNKDPEINQNKKCEKCDFVATQRSILKKHVLDVHSTKEERKKEFKYYCDVCDIGCFTENIMKAHNRTKKHNEAQQRNQLVGQNIVINK